MRRPDSAPPHYTKDELFVQPLKLNAAAGVIKKGKSKRFITSIGTKIYGAGPWPFFHIVRLDPTLPHSTRGEILFFAALRGHVSGLCPLHASLVRILRVKRSALNPRIATFWELLRDSSGPYSRACGEKYQEACLRVLFVVVILPRPTESLALGPGEAVGVLARGDVACNCESL